ncbi:MAG: hypothetical protein M3134_04295 [Actinomycetota bacterium]|nr:hypothetical protein [Actinomycetota bacterium]
MQHLSRLTTATTRVVVALLLLATVVLPNALAIAAAGCGSVTRSGFWVTYDVPEFRGGGPITSFAIDAFRPTRMFATDGKTVKRTVDGGCRWKDVLSLAGTTPVDYGFRGDAATIQSIQIPRNPTGGDRVYLAVREDTGAAARPHVVRSTDGGESWEPASAGLPPAGEPEALVVSPLNPDVAYLGVDVGGGTLDLLFATETGGTAWTLRNDLTKTESSRGIAGLELDPLVPGELWAYGPGGLFRSTDGGATFSELNEFTNDDVSHLDVYHAPSRVNGVQFAFRRSHTDVRISTDGAKTWPRIQTPNVVDSAAYGRTPNELLVSVGGRIYFLDYPTKSWIEVLTPRPGIGGLVSDIAVEVAFYGYTPGTIERYDGPISRIARPDPDGGPIFDVPGLIAPPEAQPPAPPALGPGGTKLEMKTGAKRTVDYRLKLSAKDTPLDVFFLIDTSDTMSGTIQGLIDSVAGIMNQLSTSGLDVQFGIGVSRAYTDTAVPREQCESETDTNCERNFIYRRLVDLSDFSNAEQLREALASLRAEAGGRFDSQLGALWAIATGDAIDDGPPGLQPSDVQPGQDATFRKDALNLVFVATDEPFATGDEGDRDISVSDFGRVTPPDIPSFEEVAAAFEPHDAKVLGLAIGQTLKTDRDSVEGEAPNPLDDMQRIAGLTGAIAPEGGVDCDGDGATDLLAGAELVCPVRRHNVDEGKNLASAITKLVEAVRGTTEIELEVVRGADVVAEVTPASYPAVVKQKPNVLDFEVTYECPDRLQGKDVTVQLAAVNEAGARLDSVTTAVSCLEEKVDDPPVPVEPVLTLAFVVPPLMPPGPPPIPGNAPSAQGQAQSQSQAQAQGAMAHQEQEQPQLAYVGATLDHRQAIEEELAMSDRRRSEVPQWATLGTGAVMMSLAYGWLTLSRQRSIRVQRVRRY